MSTTTPPFDAVAARSYETNHNSNNNNTITTGTSCVSGVRACLPPPSLRDREGQVDPEPTEPLPTPPGEMRNEAWWWFGTCEVGVNKDCPTVVAWYGTMSLLRTYSSTKLGHHGLPTRSFQNLLHCSRVFLSNGRSRGPRNVRGCSHEAQPTTTFIPVETTRCSLNTFVAFRTRPLGCNISSFFGIFVERLPPPLPATLVGKPCGRCPAFP